ncbi:hypothetical protein, partial [Kocuria subflava]|uniref:hypothetical protein n=1 Tax=Kocuria subflava TaxID=1736139 RepID=UPI001AE02F85
RPAFSIHRRTERARTPSLAASTSTGTPSKASSNTRTRLANATTGAPMNNTTNQSGVALTP